MELFNKTRVVYVADLTDKKVVALVRHSDGAVSAWGLMGHDIVTGFKTWKEAQKYLYLKLKVLRNPQKR